jgi:hydrogenase expression/formation protein HypC
MCLAIPGQVTEVSGKKGWVDYGDGTRREIDLTLVDARVGDYVLVHAGFAIEKLDERDAQETLRLFREMLGGSDA